EPSGIQLIEPSPREATEVRIGWWVHNQPVLHGYDAVPVEERAGLIILKAAIVDRGEVEIGAFERTTVERVLGREIQHNVAGEIGSATLAKKSTHLVECRHRKKSGSENISAIVGMVSGSLSALECDPGGLRMNTAGLVQL